MCVCVLNDDSFFSPLQIIIKYCTHTHTCACGRVVYSAVNLFIKNSSSLYSMRLSSCPYVFRMHSNTIEKLYSSLLVMDRSLMVILALSLSYCCASVCVCVFCMTAIWMYYIRTSRSSLIQDPLLLSRRTARSHR